jgi:hypothetical protein
MRISWLQEHAVSAACVSVILMLGGQIALADEKPAHNIDELLHKRLAVVDQVRRAMMADLRSGGQLNWLEVRDATVELLKARLELAKSPKDRIQVHEDMLKTAEDLEDLCSKRSKTGQERQVVALQAKALVLEIRIALERLKMNPGQSTAGR